MLIKLAKHKGFKTINIVRRRDAAEELKKLGADCVLVLGEDDIVNGVKYVTAGRGAYVSLDPVGGDGTIDIIKCTRNGGQVVIYGVLGGATFRGPIADLLTRNIVVRGFSVQPWMENLGERREEVVNEVWELMKKGILEPYTGKSFSLDDVRVAITESQKPGRGGKPLLVSKY